MSRPTARATPYKRQVHNAGVTEFAELPMWPLATIDGGWAEVARAALDFIKRLA